jgi:formylglycine-generating enzyme required for sulfatase activity
MSDDHARQIADYEAALQLALPESVRRDIEVKLEHLRAEGANLAIANTVGRDLNQGAINLSADARIDGVAVGVNLGKIIYGRDPQEDERRKLVWYLTALSNKLRRLPLRGLDATLDEGGEGMSLGRVYVELAINESSLDRCKVVADGASVSHYFENDDMTKPLKPSYHPDWVLPSAIVSQVWVSGQKHRGYVIFAEHWDWNETGPQSDLATQFLESDPGQLRLLRSPLVTEIVYQHQFAILLGDPGSGKSTFLRHLAWALAQRGLDQHSDETALVGWDGPHPPAPSPVATGEGEREGERERRQFVPIFLSLRKLAGRLAVDGVGDATVYAALRDEIEGYGVRGIDDLLSESLHSGAALLLFDGLDEVSLDCYAGISEDRLTTLKAVHVFAQLYPKAKFVVTCRTRAFDERLRQAADWPAETIAPFTLGQIRHFVPAFYGELIANEQLEKPQAEKLGTELIDTIVASPKLRAMAETPLLLTMMALVLYHDGSLPRDRPLLYERILELLLGQWDKLREGQSLAEAIGQPDWDSERVRPLLDQLSYQAHDTASSEDGRGRLKRGEVRDALIAYFEAARLPSAWESARRCLSYFEQRSGLLIPDESESYAFAHLTLQEHCAGRHMLLSPNAADLVMQRRAEDRWREPIFLGLGVVQKANPALVSDILARLIHRKEGKQRKPAERWYLDLILAAEIGKDRDWNYLRTQRVDVDRLQDDLRAGLVDLLGDKHQPLPVAERVRASLLLGELGDPRFPVAIDEWRREVERAQAGETSGYFCRVAAGTYVVGSAEDEPDTHFDEQPRHTIGFDETLLIARCPITNSQWHEWEKVSGERALSANSADMSHPNQPAIGLSYNQAVVFCAWLSDQVGATLRLPAELEWEAAARGGDGRRYPWGDGWYEDHAAVQQAQEATPLPRPAPVGCYPAGASPCGALDMAGNVWEWTTDAYRSYPEAKVAFMSSSGRRVLRGGSFQSGKDHVRCAARFGYYPDQVMIDGGFRVVLGPRGTE